MKKLCLIIVLVLLSIFSISTNAGQAGEGDKFSLFKNKISIDSVFVSEISPGADFLGHKAYVLGATKAPYGYMVYEPEVASEKLPLLLFLHGGGETGNSQKRHNQLSKAVKHGPGKLIRYGQWEPPTPMIVVSPQTTDGWWRPEMVHEFIGYLVDNYPIDRSRIYLTGLSRGGTGCFDYINMYGDKAYVAAMLPIATDTVVRNSGDFNSDNFRNTPIWLFINDKDYYVADYAATVQIIRSITTPENGSRVTVYPKRGHDAWTRTYTMKGRGLERDDYDAFDMNVYDWLLLHRK